MTTPSELFWEVNYLTVFFLKKFILMHFLIKNPCLLILTQEKEFFCLKFYQIAKENRILQEDSNMIVYTGCLPKEQEER